MVHTIHKQAESPFTFEVTGVIPEYVTIEGAVRDKVTKKPIPEASVACNGGIAFTNELGLFSFKNLAVGTYTLTANKNGYTPETKTVNCPTPGTYTVGFELVPIVIPPGVTISGIVTDIKTGKPIREAKVVCDLAETATDASGAYSFTGISTGSYTLTASKNGYKSQTKTIECPVANIYTVDFELEPIVIPPPPIAKVWPIYLATAMISGGLIAVSAKEAKS